MLILVSEKVLFTYDIAYIKVSDNWTTYFKLAAGNGPFKSLFVAANQLHFVHVPAYHHNDVSWKTVRGFVALNGPRKKLHGARKDVVVPLHRKCSAFHRILSKFSICIKLSGFHESVNERNSTVYRNVCVAFRGIITWNEMFTDATIYWCPGIPWAPSDQHSVWRHRLWWDDVFVEVNFIMADSKCVAMICRGVPTVMHRVIMVLSTQSDEWHEKIMKADFQGLTRSKTVTAFYCSLEGSGEERANKDGMPNLICSPPLFTSLRRRWTSVAGGRKVASERGEQLMLQLMLHLPLLSIYSCLSHPR